MSRLQHTVHEPQQVNSRNLGMAIQSERAFVFTNRREFDDKLGPPRKLDRVSRPSVPMRCKLLPIAEILRRRAECELVAVPNSFQACVVQNRSGWDRFALEVSSSRV